MVLQVLAHGQIVYQGNAVLFEQIGGADARELQYLRAADRAGRQNRFAPCCRKQHFTPATVLYTQHAPAFEPQLVGECAGNHREIRAFHRRTQKGFRRAPAHAVFLRHIKARYALVVAAIKILRQRYAVFNRCIAKRI